MQPKTYTTAAQFILQPQYIKNPQNICEGITLRAGKQLKCICNDSFEIHRCSEGCQCIVVVRETEHAAVMQLVFNSNLS